MNSWLLTCNPKRVFDLEALRRDGGEVDSWSVGRYRDQLAVGDPFVLWLTGPKGGPIAHGHLTGLPVLTAASAAPYWHQAPGTRWYVPLQVAQWLGTPVPRKRFAESHQFTQATIITQPFAANPHKLNAEQWKAISDAFEEVSARG